MFADAIAYWYMPKADHRMEIIIGGVVFAIIIAALIPASSEPDDE